MVLKKIKEVGKLGSFEIKNGSMVLIMLAPGLYIYSLLIHFFNPNAIEIFGAREFFFLLFLTLGLLPFTKRKFVLNNYGWFIFIPLFLFSHYLVYTTYLNGFSLDYLLGAYVVTFGVILMSNNRAFIILFCSTQLIHVTQKVFKSNLDLVTESSIIISMLTIFIFSFIILNAYMRNRKNLLEANLILEKKVKSRTVDLEERALELEAKNKDLEQFAYVVSHDLKRPLRNIYTLSQWLVDDHKDALNDDVHNNIKLIKEQATQMDLLIEGILNYSLPSEKEQKNSEVDLDVLIKKLIDLNTSKSCKINLLNKLPVIAFDEAQILQVFQNLVQNAIKHNNKEQVLIEIDCVEQEQHYVFSIKDNGPGIEEKYHKKIFQLFQTLKLDSEIDSIGIGLAMVKKIIDKNGGEVWLESTVNKGTIFCFTILK